MIRALIASVLLLTARPALALEDADYSAAVTATAQGVIIPAYQALGRAAEDLRADLDALCKAPDAATLNQARARFAEIAAAWARVQFISFGPISEHQRGFRIEYWPDKRNVVGRQLADVLAKQDEGALKPTRFATTTVGVQGLPALERLLFEEDALAKLAADDAGAQFRCGLLAAIGANIGSIAQDTINGWTEGDGSFLARIQHPSAEDEEFPTGRDVAGRVLNDLLTSTIAMRDMKLLAALGDNLEKAKPKAAEFWRSGQSAAMLAANLQGLRALFGTTDGIGGLLAAQPEGKAVTERVLATIDQAITTVEQLRLPLHEAVADAAQRKQVEQLAEEQLVQIRDLLSGPVATKLNLPIGFNALDGD